MVLVGHRDAAELVAVDALHPVMLGQALVDERVVRCQQIGDAAVLAQRASDQELGFLLERQAQIIVEVREGSRIRLYPRDIAQEQPLADEVLDQRLRARVSQQASDLGLHDRRVAEPTPLGHGQELVIGHAAPQEE